MELVWRRCKGDPPSKNNPYIIDLCLFRSNAGGLLGIVLKHFRHDTYFVVPTRGTKKMVRVGPILGESAARLCLSELVLGEGARKYRDTQEIPSQLGLSPGKNQGAHGTGN